MRLALVNVNRDVFCNRIAPLGLCSIASYLKKYLNFNNIKIVDQNTENIYESIEKIKPDVIGASSVTQNFEEAKKFIRFAKRLEVPIILGGVHISTLPSSLPKDVDIGVIGEGEETMLELMKSFKKWGFQTNKLKGIKGICYFENEKLKINEERPLIEPLDKIPIPDRSLLKIDHYLEKTSIVPFKIKRNAHIITSRGCPYKCAFCSTSIFWQKFRSFSADYVIEEINSLINKYKVELIHIFDDLFVMDERRLLKVVKKIKEQKINEKVMFMCLSRADLLNDKIMKALKEINTVCVGIGLESGSDKVLNYLKHNTTTVEQNRKAIRYCTKYKITAMGSFMIGNPNETEDDLKQTLALIKENQFNPYFSAITYITTPLPDTVLWEKAKKKGIVNEDMNWNTLCMDIPDNIDELRKAPLLTNINIKKFFQISQRFRKENESQKFKDYQINLSFKFIKKAIINPQKTVKFASQLLKTKLGMLKNKSKFESVK